jgi:hypothetical protein
MTRLEKDHTPAPAGRFLIVAIPVVAALGGRIMVHRDVNGAILRSESI